MDLIVFPIFEGAGNWAVFDAMAAAVPVLAADRCFVPEVITHGHDGLLFDPDDVAGLVRAVLTLLGDPDRRRALGRQARRTIARRFSPERAADGYGALIREAAHAAGFRARTKALMNLPSTSGAIASASSPAPARNSRASSAR
jgi:glycosyltransferase involved in cell wall biosynthesis